MLVSELRDFLKNIDGNLEVFSKTNRVSPIETSDIRIETFNIKNDQRETTYDNCLNEIKQFELSNTSDDEDIELEKIIEKYDTLLLNMPKTIPETVLVIHAALYR